MQELKKPEEQTPSLLFERYGNFQIPSDPELVDFYQGLNDEELLPFVRLETEYVNIVQGARIQLGQVFREAQQLFSRRGMRSDRGYTQMTFEKWIKAHGHTKSTSYRLIQLVNTVDKIQAQALETGDDANLMIDNFLSLSQSDQLAIAKGQVDQQTISMVLNADPKARNSPTWKKMLKELDDNKAEMAEQAKKLKEQQEQINQLTQRNSDLERSRADTTEQLSLEMQEKRHLQIQLDEAQAQEPERVEVPPDDYIELKERKLELESQLQDTNETLKAVKKELHKAQNAAENSKYTQEDIDDLQSQLQALTKQNSELTKKLEQQATKVDNKQAAFKAVSSRSTDMLSAVPKTLDVMALAHDTEQLTAEELQQTDLPALANALEDKAKQIRELLRNNERIVEGEYDEVKGDG
ncbi:hypothetical protein [Limosilactobacillus mucosae]|uniref:hypothetical protein n=1 Tax=Limosilactobacillus mucosae TaxID=97478 RepID=UPI0006528460|nr:hypothetical protein [Limosilactobacillus mucosae]